MNVASFEDKVVISTGGSSGIGRATALAFANTGAKVVIADIEEEGGQQAVQLVNIRATSKASKRPRRNEGSTPMSGARCEGDSGFSLTSSCVPAGLDQGSGARKWPPGR